MPTPDNTPTTETTPGKRRAATRVAATLAVGAAIGAAAFAGVQGLDGSNGSSSGSSSTAAAATVTASVAQSAAKYDAATIYDRTSPGVVDLTVTTSQQTGGQGLSPFGPNNGGSGQAEGTGFVIDRSGNIVTAAHVVDGATAIKVRFKDGSTAKAKLVGSDPSSDTAVIKVDVASSKLTPLSFADSAAVEPGQGVVAIGSPFGYEGSITAGIVSAVGRSIQAPNGFTIPNAIQTDAAINHGNSGGPLIDESGKVIGINVQIATGDSNADINGGVGFAVPSNTAKAVVDDLIAGKTVQHAYLGVRVGDYQGGAGAIIGTVSTDSPAARGGLRSGDVVVAIDGKRIASSSDLTSAVAAFKPGDTITLTVQRSGSTTTVKVKLGSRPATTA